jgi:hypothetical protein
LRFFAGRVTTRATGEPIRGGSNLVEAGSNLQKGLVPEPCAGCGRRFDVPDKY